MDMAHVSAGVCHSAETRGHTGSARRWEGPAPGRTQHAQGMEHPGSSCGNVWPLFCKWSQCPKKTIQKRGVIFGRVEEAGKHSLELGPGGSWSNRQTSTNLYCYRGPGQRHLPGQWTSSTGP